MVYFKILIDRLIELADSDQMASYNKLRQNVVASLVLLLNSLMQEFRSRYLVIFEIKIPMHLTLLVSQIIFGIWILAKIIWTHFLSSQLLPSLILTGLHLVHLKRMGMMSFPSIKYKKFWKMNT